ncbi:MAG: hypothetical protein QNJ18_24085, partial [Xenococcaceae cyanobacterium MO_167.B52]|nr:hypothetical protein [Xenococcaceae cyanobacterium MO_167.B52]
MKLESKLYPWLMLNNKSHRHQLFRILAVIFVGLLSWVIGTKSVSALDYTIAQFNPENLNLGKQLYLEDCSGCHIPI